MAHCRQMESCLEAINKSLHKVSLIAIPYQSVWFAAPTSPRMIRTYVRTSVVVWFKSCLELVHWICKQANKLSQLVPQKFTGWTRAEPTNAAWNQLVNQTRPMPPIPVCTVKTIYYFHPRGSLKRPN